MPKTLKAFQGLIFQTLNCAIKFNGVAHVLEIQHLLQYHAELDPNSSLLPTITEAPFFLLILPRLSDKHTHKTQSVIVIPMYNNPQVTSPEPEADNK